MMDCLHGRTAIRVDGVKKLAQVACCVGQHAESSCHRQLRDYPSTQVAPLESYPLQAAHMHAI